MSLTIQQLVLDAKNLALKLQENNSTADGLLSQSQTVHRQIDIMKQYADEVGELNESAHHRPHTSLVAGIQQENRHLRDLQHENRELKGALEEQQNALELIMSKYRQQITKLTDDSKLDLPKLQNKRYTEIIMQQAMKIEEMAAVMERASQAGDSDMLKADEEITRLSTENRGLRQLLGIAISSGSVTQEVEKKDTPVDSGSDSQTTLIDA